MIRKKITLALLSILIGCVNNSDQKLEEAKILLDEQQFSAAVQKAREAEKEDPNNLEAKLVLASALLGVGTIDASPQCKPEDKGVLGKLACLLDEKSSTETDLQTFSRIAPTSANIPSLEEATDLFTSLSTQLTDLAQQKSVYLKLYLSKLFEIGGVVATSGLVTGTACSALNDAQTTRLRNNLSTLNSDGANAGLPSSFALNGRIVALSEKLNQAASVPQFIKDQLPCD